MFRSTVAALLLLASTIASAATFTATGTVSMIQSQDQSTVNTYFPGSVAGDWFLVTGFNTAGACQKFGTTGQVIIQVKNDVQGRRQYTTALTAMSLGRTVNISVSDLNKDSVGYCYLIAVSMN